MDNNFSDLNELFRRLKPALKSKEREFKRIGYGHIKDIDIWNFLKDKVWSKANNLALHEMVSSIFMVTHLEIDKFVKEKLSNRSVNHYNDYYVEDSSLL